ncbi:MAG: hypothetical protein AAGI45_24515 [Cyanobacteria bacterium P01_H01_bin.26]
MASQTRTISGQVSSFDRALATTLAAFSMFVVGYSAVRVYLAQPAANITTVMPHQAELWTELGR